MESSDDEEDTVPEIPAPSAPDGEVETAQPMELDPTGTQVFNLLKKIQAQQSHEPDLWKAHQVDQVQALEIGGATAHPPLRLDSDEVKACAQADPMACAGEEASASFVHKYVTLGDVLGTTPMKLALKNGTFWEWLWQLLVNLRAGGGKGEGCDSSFIRNHQTCRQISKKCGWHQTLEHLCKHMNLKNGMPAHRVSRAEAWKNVAASQAKKILKLDDNSLPEVVRSGHVVLFIVPSKPVQWRVGLIMSCWYTRGKKAVPTHLPMQIEKLKVLRICIMQPDPEREEGWFKADSLSKAVVVTPFRVAVQLKCDDEVPGPDCFRCLLAPQSLQATQNAHQLAWPRHLLQDDAKACKTFGSPSPKKKSKQAAKDAKDAKDGGQDGQDDQDVSPGAKDSKGSKDSKGRLGKFGNVGACTAKKEKKEKLIKAIQKDMNLKPQKSEKKIQELPVFLVFVFLKKLVLFFKDFWDFGGSFLSRLCPRTLCGPRTATSS